MTHPARWYALDRLNTTQLLNALFVAGASSVGFIAAAPFIKSAKWATFTLTLTLIALALEWPLFQRLSRQLKSLNETSNAESLRHRVNRLFQVTVGLTGALILTHLTLRYVLGHSHESTPWWAMNFLLLPLTSLKLKFQPPASARPLWRQELKPIRSERWGE